MRFVTSMDETIIPILLLSQSHVVIRANDGKCILSFRDISSDLMDTPQRPRSSWRQGTRKTSLDCASHNSSPTSTSKHHTSLNSILYFSSPQICIYRDTLTFGTSRSWPALAVIPQTSPKIPPTPPSSIGFLSTHHLGFTPPPSIRTLQSPTTPALSKRTRRPLTCWKPAAANATAPTRTLTRLTRT